MCDAREGEAILNIFETEGVAQDFVHSIRDTVGIEDLGLRSEGNYLFCTSESSTHTKAHLYLILYLRGYENGMRKAGADR